MRLTLTLLKRKMPNGFIWRGKNRFGHHIYPYGIENMVKRLQLEERNMFLLRHPYLTNEQENGHGASLNKHEKWLNQKKLETASKKVIKSTRIEDRLGHLCSSSSWEL